MRGHLPVTLALLALACLPTPVAADQPVRLTAGFGSGARLGGQASMHLGLEVDDQRLPLPATEIRLLAPAGIDISSLGVATCRISPATLQEVLFPSFPEVRCPRNAVLGSGTATAALMFHPEHPPIRGAAADITLHSGAPLDNRPGLLILAKTSNPVSTGLAYAGRISPAPRPFGLELALEIRPPAYPPFGAAIALVRMRVTIGGDDLIYTRPVAGKRTFYRPGGVGLPSRCPRGGLLFRAKLRFADNSRQVADARVPCPRPPR